MQSHTNASIVMLPGEDRIFVAPGQPSENDYQSFEV
jgi:hypothetical protein